MKDNQIDNLFREKLGTSKINPPAGLWDKVETNLDGKKKGIYFWISIAAGLLILFTIGKLALDNTFEQKVPAQELQASAVIESLEPKPEQDKSTVIIAADKNQPFDESNRKEDTSSAKVIVSPIATSNTNLVATNDSGLKNGPHGEFKNEVTLDNNLMQSIAKIDINKSRFLESNLILDKPIVMPLSLRNISNAEFDLSDIDAPKKRKFGMIDGLISIAKGVNNAKETLSEIRTVKNDFVSKELKYGTNVETEPEEKQPNTKDEK